MRGTFTKNLLLNDEDGLVTIAVNASLMDADKLNFHPLINTESTGARPDDLLTFIASCRREAVITDLDTVTCEDAAQ